MDIQKLSFSDKLKFDISNLLQLIHSEATFLQEFPKNTQKQTNMKYHERSSDKLRCTIIISVFPEHVVIL